MNLIVHSPQAQLRKREPLSTEIAKPQTSAVQPVMPGQVKRSDYQMNLIVHFLQVQLRKRKLPSPEIAEPQTPDVQLVVPGRVKRSKCQMAKNLLIDRWIPLLHVQS